jgi:hypothetical protein
MSKITPALSFKKPPLTEEEKLEKEKAFLGYDTIPKQEPVRKKGAAKKEPSKVLYIRAPESFWEDLQEIVEATGLTLNAVCLDLIRPAIKKKLMEIRS